MMMSVAMAVKILLLGMVIVCGSAASAAVTSLPCDDTFKRISQHEECLHLTVPLTSDSVVEQDLIAEILHNNNDINTKVVTLLFHTNWELKKKGTIVDHFLTRRPWWIVFQESMHEGISEASNTEFVTLLHIPVMDHPMQKLASVQFPDSCEGKHVMVKRLSDYNEYGNELGNVGHVVKDNRGNIFVEYADAGAHWVNKKTECPHIGNQFLCSFLAHANCLDRVTIPEKHESFHYFSIDANGNSKQLTHQDYVSTRSHVGFPVLATPSTVYYLHEQKNFSRIVEVVTDHDQVHNLFYVGFLFRKNYFYRVKVAEFLREYHNQYPRYDVNEKCIAFHVRRGDRVIAGKSMVAHCKWIEEECHYDGHDHQKPFDCMQMKHDYYGLGCHTAIPYGGLGFDDFVQAARYLKSRANEENKPNILSDVKMIVVMTNDHDWAKNHSVQYEDEWNFHILPQPPHFRGSSVAHGVNNQASLDAVQQCSALVAHSSSAFSQLIFNYMCFRHGPQNNQVFGDCPVSFDFSELK